MFTIFSTVLCSVGVGALTAREAEGRANMSAGEKVNMLLFLSRRLLCFIAKY